MKNKLIGFGGKRRSAGRASGVHLLNGLICGYPTNSTTATTTTTDNSHFGDLHGNLGYMTELGSGGVDGVIVDDGYLITIGTYKMTFAGLSSADYLWNPTSAMRFGSGDFTISFRVRNTNGNNNRVAVGCIEQDSPWNWAWKVYNQGSIDKMVLDVSTDGSTVDGSVTSATTISSYHRMIMGRRGDLLWIQVDGETEVTSSFSGTLYNGGGLSFGNGKPNSSDLSVVWSHSVGACYIWNDALNQDEIDAVHGTTLTDGVTYGSFTS